MAKCRRHRDADSLSFVNQVCSRDPNVRSQSFDNLRQTIDLWLTGNLISPVLVKNNAENGLDGPVSNVLMVHERLPDFLRLIYYCPFTDIGAKSLQLLKDLQERGVKIPRRISPLSHFIPENERETDYEASGWASGDMKRPTLTVSKQPSLPPAKAEYLGENLVSTCDKQEFTNRILSIASLVILSCMFLLFYLNYLLMSVYCAKVLADTNRMFCSIDV